MEAKEEKSGAALSTAEVRIERKISGVNDSLYRMTNHLVGLKEEYGVDMWQEVIEYLKEKKEASV